MSETLHNIQRPTAEVAPPRVRETLAVAVAPSTRRKRVVIVGAGFAGIAAARALKHCDADVVLIDRRNHYIFQPLLYQVATAVLAPSEIAAPIRQLAKQQKNISVMLAEVMLAVLGARVALLLVPIRKILRWSTSEDFQSHTVSSPMLASCRVPPG